MRWSSTGRRATGRTIAIIGLLVLSLGGAGCAASSPRSGEPADADIRQSTPPAPSASETASDERFAELEAEGGARIGVYAVDTGSGSTVAYRSDERFAHASSFKALLAAAVLDRIDDLDRIVEYTPEQLVDHSPVTETRVATGMTVASLAESAVRTSDNTAANLLLDQLGGPAGFAAALAEAGDVTTRPVRYETELNSAIPGDPRDTSTPRALVETLQAFALDGALDPDDADSLVDWMTGNATGDALIRAAAPDDWVVADKSGAGGYGTRNDIGIAWPPGRDPIVIAVLTTHTEADAARDDGLVARSAAVALAALDR
jgi:beta-lactamase class A